MSDLPENDITIKHRCRACGELYETRSEAIYCFEGHTQNLGEMIERVVTDIDWESFGSG